MLVAIAIPIFTSQLEKSREATDLSNIRSAMAEAETEYLSNGAQTATTAKVTDIKQTTSGWTIEDAKLYTRVNGTQTPVALPDTEKGKTVTVSVAADGAVTVTSGDN